MSARSGLVWMSPRNKKGASAAQADADDIREGICTSPLLAETGSIREGIRTSPLLANAVTYTKAFARARSWPSHTTNRN
jgi:hypothetical protein